MRGVLLHSRPARWLAALLVVAIVAAAIPAALVYADDPEPTPSHATALARVREAELAWLERQDGQLDKAEEALAAAQDLAGTAEAEGKDVEALNAAIDAFETSMESAREAHERAEDDLVAPEAFDDDGNVVDQKIALTALQQARRDMLEAHHLTLRAVQALRKAVRAWRGPGRPEKPEDHPGQGPKPGKGKGGD